MALAFMDSFSGYSTNAVFNMLWDGSVGNAPGAVGSGRFGGDSRAIAIRDGYKDVPALDTYIKSFAVNFGSVAGTTYFAALFDGSTCHLSFSLVGGKISAYLGMVGAGGTLITSAAKAVRAGLWYHVQIKAKIHNSTGTLEIRVDGSSSSPRGIPATTGLDTQNGGSAQITRVFINTAINNLDASFSDFLLLDTTGAVNNTFPGDNKITIKFPNANGAHAQFTPLAGSNYQNVDDITPDGDATYNFDATVGHKDCFTHTSLAVTGSLIGAKHNFMHRKDDAGLREISSLCRSNSVDYTSATVITCGSNYFMDYELYELDPDTGLPWIDTDLDAAEFGLVVVT